MRRASALGLEVKRSQILELLCAAYGANNYHEVAALANRDWKMDIVGATYQVGEVLDRAFSALEREGSKTLHLICSASEENSEVSHCLISFSKEDLYSLFDHALAGGQIQSPSISFGDYCWMSEFYFTGSANLAMSYCYASASHKHGGSDAITPCFNLGVLFNGVLLPLAEMAEKSYGSASFQTAADRGWLELPDGEFDLGSFDHGYHGLLGSPKSVWFLSTTEADLKVLASDFGDRFLSH